MLTSIGGLKFTAYEVEAIRPLVETSPLFARAYLVFRAQGFSNLPGVVEPPLASWRSPRFPRAGAAGATIAAVTFAAPPS